MPPDAPSRWFSLLSGTKVLRSFIHEVAQRVDETVERYALHPKHSFGKINPNVVTNALKQVIERLVGEIESLNRGVRMRKTLLRHASVTAWDDLFFRQPRRACLEIYPCAPYGTGTQHEDGNFSVLKRLPDFFEPDVTREHLTLVRRQECVNVEERLDDALHGFRNGLVFVYETEKYSRHAARSIRDPPPPLKNFHPLSRSPLRFGQLLGSQ